MPEFRLCAKISNNNENLKSISEYVDTKNWETYRVTLKSVQKDVNSFLTDLVDREKSNAGVTEIDNDDASDSASESCESPPKRTKLVGQAGLKVATNYENRLKNPD